MNPLLAHSIPPGAGRSWEQCPSCMARPHTGRGPFPEPLASTTQPLQDQATDCPDGLSQTQSPPSGLFPPKGVTGLLSPRPHPTSSPSRIGGGTPDLCPQPASSQRKDSVGRPSPAPVSTPVHQHRDRRPQPLSPVHMAAVWAAARAGWPPAADPGVAVWPP